MPRKKKIEEPVEEPIEEPAPEIPLEEEKKVVPEEESEAKKAFRVLIEKYRVQNPTKYQLKEAELLTKLNSL